MGVNFISISRLWLVRPIGQEMVVAISNLINVVFRPLLAPMQNFIQIRQKTQKLKIFTVGQFWLVGLLGQKMVIAIPILFYVVFGPSSAPIPNFIQIGQKIQKWKIFAVGQFWLVGRKMVTATSNIRRT